jgi:hypothetical protein
MRLVLAQVELAQREHEIRAVDIVRCPGQEGDVQPEIDNPGHRRGQERTTTRHDTAGHK